MGRVDSRLPREKLLWCAHVILSHCLGPDLLIGIEQRRAAQCILSFRVENILIGHRRRRA